MTKYEELKPPLFSIPEIIEKANRFRLKYHGDKSCPVDIVNIVESDLDIYICPISELESRCGTDSFITTSWDKLYVDIRKFGNESYDKRMNFSIAHEVGHFILHKGYRELIMVDTIGDYYRYIEKCPENVYKVLERQANIFAANLLVPGHELKSNIKFLQNKIKEGKIDKLDIGIALSDNFQVSKDVIVNRILNEKIDLDFIDIDN